MNLLLEPMLPLRRCDRELAKASLPQLLEAMGTDAVDGLPFMRPHQRHPWHVFLVQLAALALHRARETEVRHPAERWVVMLRALTAKWPDNSPWRLVVEDLANPAFMQPPVQKDTLVDFRRIIVTPDDIDVLITSKNYGIKQASPGLRFFETPLCR